MSKENLFELIRKEEIVIWAGAGMSMYAGYPSGNDLKQIIYEDFNKEIKNEIEPTLPLMDMAEMYVRSKAGSRNELNGILTKVFRAKPKSTEFHDILATIPHIRTIITTNYDNLFESAYGEQGHSIFLSNQVANFAKDKIEIFKAHGDLSNTDSLIISRTDYDRFFKDDSQNNLFWNSIRTRIATKAVLFLGYSLEDSNVSVIFDKITEELKQNRKQVFLVSPNMSRINQMHLSSKGIQYIDSTGEKLINEILQTLQENIVSDFEDNKISIISAGTFLKNQNISAELIYAGGKQKIGSIQPMDPSIIGSLRFKVDSKDSIAKSISEFISGEKIGSLKIPKEKILELEMWLGNTRISSRIQGLTIQHIPSGTWNVMLRFEDGFEYDDVIVNAYRSANSILILKVQLKRVSIDIDIDISNGGKSGHACKFSYTHEHHCGRVKDEVDVFTLLSKVTNGDNIMIFHQGKCIHTGAYHMMKPLYEQVHAFFKFFDGLRQIEKYYQLVFSNINFDMIDNVAASHITEILAFMDDGHVDENFKHGMVIDLDPTDNNHELEIIKDLPKKTLQLSALSEHVFNLFGHKFNLGFMVYQINMPEIKNRARVLKGLDHFVLLKSKTNQRMRFFTKSYMGPKI